MLTGVIGIMSAVEVNRTGMMRLTAVGALGETLPAPAAWTARAYRASVAHVFGERTRAWSIECTEGPAPCAK